MSIKFLIVDGNSLGCRAAFAHNTKFGPDLTNSAGKVTGPTYRFFNMLDKILNMIKPTHVVIAWDVGRETWRNQLDESYKANREKKNDDLYVQFNDIKKILELIGIKNVGVQGYEGDDVVGTYVNLSNADKNFIVSGDKDSFQLADEKTVIIYPNHGFKDIHLVDPEYIENKYGIPYDKFVDLKALMGDDGDNVKGIENCGEKTAVKLLNHYGSVENVADNANDIDLKGINVRVKAGIIEWAPRSIVVKDLVTIRRDVNVPYDFDQCRIDLNWENARAIFKELEFNSFLKKLNGGEFFNGKK